MTAKFYTDAEIKTARDRAVETAAEGDANLRYYLYEPEVVKIRI